MTGISDTISALTGEQSIRVLALTADHEAPLPDPGYLGAMESGLRDAIDSDTELASYAEPDDQPPDAGDLARVTLLYLADAHPELVPVIAQAIELPPEGTRDPVTLAVGALVVLALQTEVKLTRSPQGHWTFTFHKHHMRDSTLGQVISKLIAAFLPGGG